MGRERRLVGAPRLFNQRHSYPEEQQRVLHDLHALYLARTGAGYSAHLRYGDEKSIELSAITSSALMPLLEQAQRVGIRLVHADSELGDVEPVRTADLCLDVRAADDGPDGAGSLEVVPVLRVEGSYGE